MIIIVGASGYIGNSLFNRFKKENFDVIGTYFRNKKPGLFYLDLESPDLNKFSLNMKNIRYMIIAAAANASIDNTKKYWDYSYYINVVKTKILIDFCFKHGITPIYLSSDGVFDGTKGYYSEEDKRNPINCYGKIRYEVENYIINSGMPYLILRMGRVFGTELEDGTLITGMLKTLRENKSSVCAIDHIFTPMNIEYLFSFVKASIENRYHGIFHLASLKATSKYKIAKAIQKFFKLKGINIIPCEIDSLNLLEKRPKRIDLNISKYKKLTGYREKPIGHFLSLIR